MAQLRMLQGFRMSSSPNAHRRMAMGFPGAAADSVPSAVLPAAGRTLLGSNVAAAIEVVVQLADYACALADCRRHSFH